jgi:hypothetical protein
MIRSISILVFLVNEETQDESEAYTMIICMGELLFAGLLLMSIHYKWFWAAGNYSVLFLWSGGGGLHAFCPPHAEILYLVALTIDNEICFGDWSPFPQSETIFLTVFFMKFFFSLKNLVTFL